MPPRLSLVNQRIQFAKRTIGLLTPRQKKIFVIVVPIALFLSLLDFLGVILLASLGTMGFKYISGDPKPTRVELFLQNITNLNLDSTQVSVLFLSLAIICLILKTILGAYFSLKLTKWLARVDAQLSDLANKTLLYQSVDITKGISPGNTLNLVVNSSTRLTSGTIQAVINLIVDSSLVIVLGVLLFAANPSTATLNLVVLVSAAAIMRYFVKGKIKQLGERIFALQTTVHDSVITSTLAFKEIRIYGLQKKIRDNYVSVKFNLTWASLKISFLNGLFRYFLEIALLVSSVLIFLGEFVFGDLRRAITALILFLAAGLRLVPSIQRIQSSLLSIRLSEDMTKPYFDFISTENVLDNESNLRERKSITSAPSIEARNLSVGTRTVGASSVVENINFFLPAGSILAIVGESGSGKTTLLDALSGLTEAKSGTVEVSASGHKHNLNELLVGYCTQNPFIVKESLMDNFVFDGLSVERDILYKSLGQFNLSDLLDERVWEDRKDSLSGGERLRIGLIRCMGMPTSLLLYDEPTSALDELNALKVISLINSFSKSHTQLIATHDKRIIENASHILVLKNGSQIEFKENGDSFKS